jgi:hypothetical protein
MSRFPEPTRAIWEQTQEVNPTAIRKAGQNFTLINLMVSCKEVDAEILLG